MTKVPVHQHACRNYIWTFAVLLAVWAALLAVKPRFILDANGRLSYKKLFWVTLIVTIVVVVGICYSELLA